MSKSQTHSVLRDWHKEDIKAAIRKKGVSMADLARANNYNPRTFSNVFHLKYPKVESIIADFLGTAPQIIWPSRYQEPALIQPYQLETPRVYRKVS